MSHNNPKPANNARSLFVLILTLLFGTSLLLASTIEPLNFAAPDPNDTAEPEAPVALIKSIIGVGTEPLATDAVTVKRVDNNSETAQTGMFLYRGDQVITENAQSTLLFLDDVAEKNNEVVVDVHTKIQIGSIYDWFGRVIIRVKGAFETRTEKVKLGVQGTEFELFASPTEDRVTVLEGVVTAEQDSRGPSASRSTFDNRPESTSVGYLKTSFTQEAPAVAPIPFEAYAGQITTRELTLSHPNACKKEHVFQVRLSQALKWISLTGNDQVRVKGQGTEVHTITIRIEATNIPAATYDSELLAICVDCKNEKRCRSDVVSHPIRISLLPPVTQPGQKTLRAGKKQQIIVTANKKFGSGPASDEQISEVVTRSNDAIIQSHQSYTAQSITPNFPDTSTRDQAFAQARRNAALRGDPLSYQQLGDALLDMGDGAKAIDAYEHVGKTIRPTPAYFTNLGEAYRLAGRFQEAVDILVKALELNPNWAPAFNALGNLHLDQASVERDKHNYDVARDWLEKAKGAYTRASQTPTSHHPTRRPGRSGSASDPRIEQGIVQSNLGEVYRAFGDIALDQGHERDALAQYQTAEQKFNQAQVSSPRYAFAQTGLGSVYRELNKVAEAHGDKPRAADYFERSQKEYSIAYNQHKDLAPAYVGLGNLYENAGGTQAALKFYATATRVRPEEPTGHYHLALMLAKSNPRLAAAHAHAYLSSERKPFQQGDKAKNARRVKGAGPLQSSPSSSPSPSPSPWVRVAGVDGKTREEALRKLADQGLRGEIREEADCKPNGKVQRTSPGEGERVPSGALVTVFISVPGEITVPQVANLEHPLSLAEARQRLEKAGLSATVGRSRGNNSVPQNTVLDQKPEAGTKLKAGCPVELTIAIPARLISVPKLIGKSKEAALQQLLVLFGELIPGRVREAESDQPAGTVIEQSPGPEKMVPPGTVVDLVISKSPQVEVPNLIGMTEKEARSAIDKTNGRLRLGTIEYVTPPNTSCEASEKVLEQNPQAKPGQKAPIQTRINLKIFRRPIC